MASLKCKHIHIKSKRNGLIHLYCLLVCAGVVVVVVRWQHSASAENLVKVRKLR